MNEISKTLLSTEVSEMVGKDHCNLIKDIRRYSAQLAEVKINSGDFFEKSMYKDANSQARPCYLVTKKGCEFIANKLTGTKGTEFTARYINKFNEMESEIIFAQQPSGTELIALAVLEAQKIIKEKEMQIAKLEPMAYIGEAVTGSETSIKVGEMAKILTQAGYTIGQKQLFSWLRKNGYLFKNSNEPMQRYVIMGIFEVREHVVKTGNNCFSSFTTLITGKGQEYFLNKFKDISEKLWSNELS